MKIFLTEYIVVDIYKRGIFDFLSGFFFEPKEKLSNITKYFNKSENNIRLSFVQNQFNDRNDLLIFKRKRVINTYLNYTNKPNIIV